MKVGKLRNYPGIFNLDFLEKIPAYYNIEPLLSDKNKTKGWHMATPFD